MPDMPTSERDPLDAPVAKEYPLNTPATWGRTRHVTDAHIRQGVRRIAFIRQPGRNAEFDTPH